MAFFRKWKLYTKHKKLSEDWGLAKSLKDLSEPTEGDDDSGVGSSFNLKYLGCTPIGPEKSKNATAEAVKTVISSAKTTRRKAQRVNVNVSPRGIEMVNAATGTQMLRVSIYKISYCSADAAHGHVFAFIGSPEFAALGDATTEDITPAAAVAAAAATAAAAKTTQKFDAPEMATTEDLHKLTCYVFLCPKRRIAHDVTLTVARCFENAYRMWRHTVERKMLTEQLQNRSNKDNDASGKEKSGDGGKEEPIRDLLIDFTPDIPTNLLDNDHRQYLQNTWVAFDDESKDVDRFCNASWEQPLVC